MESIAPYIAPVVSVLMLIITVAIHIFTFGKFKGESDGFRNNIIGRFDSLETSVKDEFKGFRLTLFGVDGRNGIVGDLHEVKGHIRLCKTRNGFDDWNDHG